MTDDKKTKSTKKKATKKVEKIEKVEKVEKVKKQKLSFEELNVQEESFEEIIEKKKRRKFRGPHISFTTRIVTNIIEILVCLAITNALLKNSINFVAGTYFKCTEKSNLDYRIHLKENDFYTTDYLPKDMIYVANLIDTIELDFKYLFEADSNIDLKFNFNIYGVLTIVDPNTKDVYFTKEYNIKDNKSYDLVNKNKHEFGGKIPIDYDYYNKIANEFKSNYGVDAESTLSIKLEVIKNSPNNKLKLDNTTRGIINIPLSEKAIKIQLDYNNIDEQHSVVNESKVEFNNHLRIALAISITSLAIYLVVRLAMRLSILRKKKDIYDSYVNKILFQYDRVIVETKKTNDFTGLNIIEVKNFTELLDVRDNLKCPIIYNSIHKHQKCHFYIKNNNDLYLLVIKKVDLEEKKNEVHK